MHAQGMFWAVILARLSFERERSEGVNNGLKQLPDKK